MVSGDLLASAQSPIEGPENSNLNRSGCVNVKFKSDPRHLLEDRIPARTQDFSDEIAYTDHKVAFAIEGVDGLDVLDIGCVEHDPNNYRSKYYIHKALVERANLVVGIDLSEKGVKHLQTLGFNAVHADAQHFKLGRRFDIIFAGDIIEHLEDFSGFLKSCKAHLKPGGQIRISTPNPWYWKNIIKAIINVEVNNNPEHTCWLCPRTFRQLISRHGLVPTMLRFGSRYWSDRLMPLPRGIKHSSWHVVVKRKSEV